MADKRVVWLIGLSPSLPANLQCLWPLPSQWTTPRRYPCAGWDAGSILFNCLKLILRVKSTPRPNYFVFTSFWLLKWLAARNTYWPESTHKLWHFKVVFKATSITYKVGLVFLHSNKKPRRMRAQER